MRAAGQNPVRWLARAFPRSLEGVSLHPADAGYRLRIRAAIGVGFDALWRALGPTLAAEVRNGR